MKPFKNWTLKYKFITPIIIVASFLYLGLIITTYFTIQRAFSYNSSQTIETKIAEIQTNINHISNDALYIASLAAEMQIVKKAYGDYYNTKDLHTSSQILYSYFRKINNNIFSSSGHNARIHFHLPPAISFCRCWSEVRGDDISEFRTTVLEVSKSHHFAKGIETGRGGFVIRGIAPIFSITGNYLGSVEAFFNINHLIDDLDVKNRKEFAILMDTDLLKIATNFLEDTSSNIKADKQVYGDYILVDKSISFNEEHLLKYAKELNDSTVIENGNYIYASFPIKNSIGKIEGIGVIQIDNSKSNNLIKKMGFISLAIAFILILFSAIFVVKFQDKFIVSKITTITESLNSLAKGESIKEITIESQDEMGSIQESVNKLNKSIRKNKESE